MQKEEKVELLHTTIGAELRAKARSDKDRNFIVYSDRDLRWSYGAFDKRVDDLAKGFLTIGLRKGDHVGIWAANVPDWLTVFFAIVRAGMVAVTVNTGYKTYELEYLIKQSDLKALCIIDGYRDSDYVGMIYDLVPELRTSPLGNLNSERFPCLKMVVNIGDSKHRGMYHLSEVLLIGSNRSDSELSEIESQITDEDVACIMYTSGTTGNPKGVMLTHFNLLNNGKANVARGVVKHGSIVCLPLPLFHVYGLSAGILSILVLGATAAMLENFDPLMFMAVIQKEKCDVLYGVTTMFISMLNHPMLNMFDFSSVKTGGSGGSLAPVEMIKQVMVKFHCPGLYSGYGLTECSPVVTTCFPEDPAELRTTTIGKAVPGVEVSIRDPENNNELPSDTQGEICVRGHCIMKGYYKMEEETKKIIDAEGWLHTGDLGQMNKDGYINITGRIKDLIIRGGENIYPKEVEDFLYTMPGIKEIQVTGVPSNKYGEEVAAFIVLKDKAALNEEDVQDFCRGKISNFKIPRYVFFQDSFPTTASGKVQKFKLRETGEMLIQKAGTGT
ncbi:AMP-binding protein [Spirochaetia bacterium]|nr:AMP-binding protein [Spirochaetia bacterium]